MCFVTLLARLLRTRQADPSRNHPNPPLLPRLEQVFLAVRPVERLKSHKGTYRTLQFTLLAPFSGGDLPAPEGGSCPSCTPQLPPHVKRLSAALSREMIRVELMKALALADR